MLGTASRGQRVGARAVDGAWLLVLFLGLAGLVLPAWYGRSTLTMGVLMLLMFVGLHVAVETLFLTLWGRTPGKALWGLTVQSVAASRLPLDVAAARSGLVMVQGLGLCVLPLAAITTARTWLLLGRGPAPWDAALHTCVVAESPSRRQVLGWSAFIALAALFAAVGWTRGVTSLAEQGPAVGHASPLLTRLTGQWLWVNKLTGRAAALPQTWRLLSESTDRGAYVARFVRNAAPVARMEVRHQAGSVAEWKAALSEVMFDLQERGYLIEFENRRANAQGRDGTYLIAAGAGTPPRYAIVHQVEAGNSAWAVMVEVDLPVNDDSVNSGLTRVVDTFLSKDGVPLQVADAHYWLNPYSGRIVQLPAGWRVYREVTSPAGGFEMELSTDRAGSHRALTLRRVPKDFTQRQQVRGRLAKMFQTLEVNVQPVGHREVVMWTGTNPSGGPPQEVGAPKRYAEGHGEWASDTSQAGEWGWMVGWSQERKPEPEERAEARTVALLLLDSTAPRTWWSAWDGRQ
jgi:uncharacterized RDD family membrane protein YckC